MTVMSPYTRESWATVPAATTGDVDRAYEAAVKVQKQWVECPHSERIDVVDSVLDVVGRCRDEIVDTLIHEARSTRQKVSDEVDAATEIMMQDCGYPDRVSGSSEELSFGGKANHVHRDQSRRDGIIAWKYPFYPTSRIVAPALASVTPSC